MHRLEPSYRIYIGLILALAALGALSLFLPQGTVVPTVSDSQLPASPPVMALAIAGIMIVIYGGLGFLGLLLARRLGFAPIWSSEATVQERLVLPAVIGAGIGLFFIVADAVFSRFHALGPLPHPPFPTSLVASATAGIGEEALFRLFLVPLWTWLISVVVLRGKAKTMAFWIAALISALAFAAGHLPALMLLAGFERLSKIPTAVLAEILLLNGGLALVAAVLLRRYGFLAAVGVHFWADVVWHVVWGALG